MSLPHFTSHYNYSNYYQDAVQQSAVEVLFDNLKMSNNCRSIEKNIMTFNFNVFETEIIPYDIIKKMISNNEIIKYLEIRYFSKNGSRIYSTFLNNFRFVKILNFLDFDWSKSNDIKDLKVIFKYDGIYTAASDMEYNKFIRRIKIENINDCTEK